MVNIFRTGVAVLGEKGTMNERTNLCLLLKDITRITYFKLN